MDIEKFKLSQQALDLCLLIEKLPCSPQQTEISIKASELRANIIAFIEGAQAMLAEIEKEVEKLNL